MDENNAKRIKTDDKLKGINIYLIKEEINSRRLKVLINAAKSHGIVVNERFSDCVDYIISDVEYEETVHDLIGLDLTDFKAVILNTKWFTDCIESKKLMPSEKKYRLKHKKNQTSDSTTDSNDTKYICQQKSPLKHYNEKLTDALELLAYEAQLHNSLFDEVRYLAFRKASAALKSLPFAVTNIDEVSNLKNIGKHSKKIIMEILDEGSSAEVKQIENSVRFKTMRLFTNVYGIGPKTAQQWYDIGLRTIDDVIKSKTAIRSEHKRVLHGLAYYNDLNEPMSKVEANRILTIVRGVIQSKFPSDHTKIETIMTGGFCRGKEFGHDLDLLITHRDEGSEKGLLQSLFTYLKDMNYILLGNFGPTHGDNEIEVKYRDSTLDNFDKVFSIFKLPLKENESDLTSPDLDPDNTKAFFEFAESDRKMEWKARRLDLIVCPYSQLPFALIGWTGNEIFVRSLKDYAKKEMNMKLTNHSLHDLTKETNLMARNEIEVFELLKLPFIEPQFRNP